MKYDFTTIMDRRGQDAIAVETDGNFSPIGNPDVKVKEGFDFIPMWVADMNFPTFPGITEAMTDRIGKPHFGYFEARKEYFDSIIAWHKNRFGVEDLKPEYIGYENGVLGGVVSALKAMACPGDAVLVHSPTYIGFTHALEDNGFRIIHSELIQDEAGIYRMNYEDMDSKIKANNIHAAIFCSPHNPTGRVWEKEEIAKALAVYEANDVKVVSDEIWADIVLKGHKHTPTLQVNEWAKKNVCAMYAPSKTFSLAGLVGSYHVIYDKTLRDRAVANCNRTHYNGMNVLSQYALIGAYTSEGEVWTDELCETITGNIDFAVDFIENQLKGVKVSKAQGTYMLFLDLTEYCANSGRSLKEVMECGYSYGVGWQDGRPFHGPCHIRMNLALPRVRVEEAFNRLKKYVFV